MSRVIPTGIIATKTANDTQRDRISQNRHDCYKRATWNQFAQTGNVESVYRASYYTFTACNQHGRIANNEQHGITVADMVVMSRRQGIKVADIAATNRHMESTCFGSKHVAVT